LYKPSKEGRRGTMTGSSSLFQPFFEAFGSIVFLIYLMSPNFCRLKAVLPLTNHSEPINIEPICASAPRIRHIQSTPHQLCHEQQHNGICEAFDDARGSKPSSCGALEASPPVHSGHDSSRRVLDDRSSIRHAFWATTTWLPIAQAGKMG
jgi:hypothetical protein